MAPTRSVVGVLALCALAAAAKNKRVPPPRVPSARELSTTTACDNFAGTWTGFEGTTPLYDNYQLSWRGGEYPTGAFTAVYISAPSWSLGVGQFSADNSTIVMTLDASATDVLHGTVSDGCATIAWDNGSFWRRTTNLPKRVHMVAMNHLDGE